MVWVGPAAGDPASAAQTIGAVPDDLGTPGGAEAPRRHRDAAPRRVRRRALAGAVLFLLTACAKMGAPPGGPPDQVPPKLLATVPESLGAYPGWDRDVEFRFDEIISEGSSPSQGTGTGDLERLILVSPSKGIPVIHWKRDRITVRPRDGWKPNRVYRIQLLPGITDLRRNKVDSTTVLTFSTGTELPTDTVRGLAIDWVAGKPAIGALVELVLQPDSLVYRAVTDSSGRFAVGPLPHGSWWVYAAIDQNHNLQRERRESYDSAQVGPGEPVPPLWLIPRDTVGPRIQQITPTDSVSATIAFSQPLDPAQRFDSLPVRFVLLPDSTPVAIQSLLPKAVDDSLRKLAAAQAESLRAARDTTRKAAPPAAAPQPKIPVPAGVKPPAGRGAAAPKVDLQMDSIIKSRPALFDKLVLRVPAPFQPEAKYFLELQGIRSAAGVAGDAKGGLAIPKPRPAPAPEAGDTTGAHPADSTGAHPKPAPPDSTVKPAPPPSPKP